MDEVADKIIQALDEYGRNYASHEYGLPTYEASCVEDMQKIVRAILVEQQPKDARFAKCNMGFVHPLPLPSCASGSGDGK